MPGNRRMDFVSFVLLGSFIFTLAVLMARRFLPRWARLIVYSAAGGLIGGINVACTETPGAAANWKTNGTSVVWFLICCFAIGVLSELVYRRPDGQSK